MHSSSSAPRVRNSRIVGTNRPPREGLRRPVGQRSMKDTVCIHGFYYPLRDFSEATEAECGEMIQLNVEMNAALRAMRQGPGGNAEELKTLLGRFYAVVLPSVSPERMATLPEAEFQRLH